MQSYSFEIVAGRKTDEEGLVIRNALVIASGSGLVVEPKDSDLLVKYAAEILKANATGSEVSVNIRPFLG